VGSPDLTSIFDPATALIVGMLLVGIGALVSGKFVVPRFIYDREREAREKAETQVGKLTDLLEDYNQQLRTLRRGQTDA
jgi:hypothetical protein